MRTRTNISVGLSSGDTPARAVPINNGTGANLWVGDICITANSAAEFRELAQAAADAARIQEEADARLAAPHAFVEWPPVAGVTSAMPSCWHCRKDRTDAVHAGALP